MKPTYLLAIALFSVLISQAQIIDIPDANFKNALVNWTNADLDGDGNINDRVDTNNDGEIQVSEAEAVLGLEIDWSGHNITSLEGIQYFSNLTYLECSRQDITDLDLTSLANLETFFSEYNTITSLNLNGLINLKTLELSNGVLTELDLSSLNNIEVLILDGNSFSTLDVSNLSNLKVFDCLGNQLTSLDVSPNTSLIELNCSSNNISSIILGIHPNLEKLTVSYNPLPNLELDNTLNLIELDINYTNLTTINTSPLSNLKILWCNASPSIDIDFTQLSSLELLGFSFNDAESIDLTQNTNLITLISNQNLFSSIDLSQNTRLEFLRLQDNNLTSLDISNNANLKSIYCSDNQLTSLDLSNNTSLLNLSCGSNQLTSLDLNNNTSLTNLSCGSNQLESIFIKNGVISSGNYFNSQFNIGYNPNLIYVCADEDEIQYVKDAFNHYGYINTSVSSYCSFVPGGQFFTIQGISILDSDSDSCDINDNSYPNLNFNITNGTINGTIISNDSGNYSIPVTEGTHTISPQLENPIYFTVSPTSITADFPTDASPYIQDFCITPNGTHNDLEITLIPLNQARPGFNANYKLVYKNKGTTTLTGSIDLMFQDDVMDLVSASPVADSQTLNNLSWNYSNLEPFESGVITITMNLNTPTETPALNGGDELGFTATINPVTGDETPADNTISIKQIVVNSYDPNDKTCLEGTTITPELVGKYVHYLIRFENTGSASAINVVVKDIIDTAKFDVSTLFLTDVSHDVVTRINNGNEVEFIFENINLPFDDANNDGYIAFKIKTLPTLVEGDTFENDAEIYFDFNFPIDTNIATTTVESTLNTAGFEMANIDIYPNPVQNRLMIKGQDVIKSVAVYDISGRLINQVSFIGDRTEVSVSTEALAQGSYFVNVKTATGEGVRKLVKE